ncbi:Protein DETOXIFICATION 42 [Glycine soja]
MIFGFSKAEKLTHSQRSTAGRFDVKESRCCETHLETHPREASAGGFVQTFSIINESHHCVTLAASLAAQQGPTSMAAFQVCLQVWLAVSLLADGLVVAGQVVVAILSIICLLILSSVGGFIGIWVALTIYMGLRAFAGFLSIDSMHSLLVNELMLMQNWNGVRTLGVPKELMTAHGRHRSYSFILGLGFSGVC